jgi:hypothetical protein
LVSTIPKPFENENVLAVDYRCAPIPSGHETTRLDVIDEFEHEEETGFDCQLTRNGWRVKRDAAKSVWAYDQDAMPVRCQPAAELIEKSSQIGNIMSCNLRSQRISQRDSMELLRNGAGNLVKLDVFVLV